jgi:hypothetical protein
LGRSPSLLIGSRNPSLSLQRQSFVPFPARRYFVRNARRLGTPLHQLVHLSPKRKSAEDDYQRHFYRHDRLPLFSLPHRNVGTCSGARCVGLRVAPVSRRSHAGGLVRPRQIFARQRQCGRAAGKPQDLKQATIVELENNPTELSKAR